MPNYIVKKVETQHQYFLMKAKNAADACKKQMDYAFGIWLATKRMSSRYSATPAGKFNDAEDLRRRIEAKPKRKGVKRG